MSNTPALDIIQYLVARGVGAYGGNSVFSLHEGGLPSEPDSVIGLVSSEGLSPDTDQLNIFRPGFQVLVRGTSRSSAYEKQCEIRDLLIYPIPVDTLTSVFTQIDLSSDFLDLGQDQNRRYIWSANYGCHRVMKANGD